MTSHNFNYREANCTGCGHPMIHRVHHSEDAHDSRFFCDVCLIKILRDDMLAAWLLAKDHEGCERCGSSFAVWWLGAFDVPVCLHAEIELKERLFELCDPANAKTRFVDFVALLWLEYMVDGDIPADFPIAEAVFKLAEQQLWPPEWLRDHKRISNWVTPDEAQVAV